MNVLHINSYYYQSHFYKNMYERMLNESINLKVFVPVEIGKQKEDFDHGDYSIISNNFKKYHRMIFYRKHILIYRDLLSKINLNEFNCVHAHSLFSNGYIAWKLKKEFGIPYIVAVRNTDINIFLKLMPHLRSLGIKILREANKIIFISSPYKKKLLEKYIPDKFKQSIKNKSIVIPNGIDEFWLKNLNYNKGKISHRIKMIQVGNIDKNKNIKTTVESCKRLIDQGFDIELNIVGKIVDKKIFNSIKDINFISYHGVLNKEKLINVLRKSDIFLMPSLLETFGLVYAEAMTQGLPVIYTSDQGFDEHFPPGLIGYPVNAMDSSEIVEKVKLIMSNYEIISKNCVESVEKFSWDSISNIYIELYNETQFKNS